MRLGKRLAHAGVASRRASETLIAEGRVTVAGEIVRDPARDVDETVAIAVDGKPLSGAEERVLYALHKPVGVLSTADDPFGRPTVVELLSHESRRLYPVGRLDLDSSGLILLTNDGALAHALTHPRFEVAKTYEATVRGGRVSERALARLRAGVELEDGMTAPAEVRRLPAAAPRGAGRGARGASASRKGRRTAAPRPPAGERLSITIREGRNRQVRRMCAAVGHEVDSLVRVAFGPLPLGALRPGASRRLTGAEVEALREATGGPTSPRAAALEESAR